jgi:hypothetical protein
MSSFGKVLKKLREEMERLESFQGSASLDLIDWQTIAEMLDRVAPAWAYAVRSVTPVGDKVVVAAAITIEGVTREGIGTGTLGSLWGVETAEHEALKCAAVKFGLGRNAGHNSSDRKLTKHGEIKNPVATTMRNLVTPRQLGMLRSLTREAGLDMNRECRSRFGCVAEELSRFAAADLIADLSKQKDHVTVGPIRRAS